MWTYAALLFFSILVPLALSFDKKLQFYTHWKYLFPSLFIVSFFYIIFDIYFTRLGVWGFNPLYHSNIVLINLPLEEWLFFIVIPYASIFLHESLVLYFPGFKLSSLTGRAFTFSLILFLAVVILVNYDKAYTVYIFSLLMLALVLTLLAKAELIQHFYLTFLVILIPFIAVNAILTGSFIEEEVVWYNNSENLGIRLLTIPVEDFGYAFSLILFNLLLTDKLKKRTRKEF
jgi:lycopene cyclase domain-containing protein